MPFDAKQFIRDLLQIFIKGKIFDPREDPSNDDVIAYNAGEERWVFKPVPFTEHAPFLYLMNSGWDLDLGDGDLILDSGALVDGVDVSEKDAASLSGRGLAGDTASPVANSMLYYTGEWHAGKSSLLNGTNSTDHFHNTDRARGNHTGTQAASTISDFDTEVSNNTDVAANTAARHTHVYFCGYTASNIATNGASWVTLDLYQVSADGFSVASNGEDIIADSDVGGNYIIHAEAVSDYNNDNAIMYIRIQQNDGSWSTLAGTERETHTSSALKCMISTHFGPTSIAGGDMIRVQLKFSSADAGSNFLARKCAISIFQVD